VDLSFIAEVINQRIFTFSYRYVARYVPFLRTTKLKSTQSPYHMIAEYLGYKELCANHFQAFLNVFPMRISGFAKAEKTTRLIRIYGVSSAYSVVSLKR